MRYLSIAALFVGIFVYVLSAQAQMTSTNYQIQWDSINSGGDDMSSSSSYLLQDTLGESGGGNSIGALYQVDSGYRQGIFDQILTFELNVQSNGTAQAATSLSSTDVYTTTAGFSVGDFVAIVQDLGESQVVGIGKVTTVAVDHLTLDEISDGGSAPVIDGTNDYVYKLTGVTGAFGTFSTTEVSTVVVGFNVTSDNDDGYVVQVKENGNLVAGIYDIDDVSDGAVTSGSEEYGARSSDVTISSSTFDTQDSAITTSFQDVVTETAKSFEKRHFLILKAGIATSTTAGSYSQNLSFIVSGNY